MIKVMLVCNAGLSTSMMAKKIEVEGKGEFEVQAYGESEYQQHLDGISCILTGPQVRYLIEDIKNVVGKTIPVAGIEPRVYGTMNGAKVIEQIRKMIEG
ncbi:PTS system, Lactose/Cellobiose specific IIB subunit [Popillia japonica]|uniref:PTS system, Lactose/Cellobiose specific IIB subunit n=1 Tax=Popillia japonica TaxID=7064 RepID=A0AAW1H6Z5_POPJA